MKRAILVSMWFLSGLLAGALAAQCTATQGAVVADRKGRYRIQSHFPPSSTGMAPHIHMAVAADGFVPIQTECFPARGSSAGTFDIVLEPGG